MAGLLAQGRAICHPIYKGQFYRNGGYDWREGGISLRDNGVSAAKDLSRTVDYLRSRYDIDHQRIVYLGDSYGAAFGPVMLSCGASFSGAIFVAGGLCDPAVIFRSGIPPEVDPFNYLQLVTTPTLLLSDKHDAIFPRNVSQLPFFDGMPSLTKERHEYDSFHGGAPPAEALQRIEEWFDVYLGKVNTVQLEDVTLSRHK